MAGGTSPTGMPSPTGTGMPSVGASFIATWHNPSSIVRTVVLLVGGDIVQTALAQLTGSGIAPVAFSFGWVSYSFKQLIAMTGDGRLMPPPDYACKAINTENGYSRNNRSWVLGRLLRDTEPVVEPEEALVVCVYDAKAHKKRKAGRVGHGWSKVDSLWVWTVISMIAQIVLSSVPFILFKDWGIFAITLVGTFLALLTSALPQWRAEKLACRNHREEGRKKTMVLTQGNGALYAMVIRCTDFGLDLEDLAAGASPRLRRTWVRYGFFNRSILKDGEQKFSNDDKIARRVQEEREKAEEERILADNEHTLPALPNQAMSALDPIASANADANVNRETGVHADSAAYANLARRRDADLQDQIIPQNTAAELTQAEAGTDAGPQQDDAVETGIHMQQLAAPQVNAAKKQPEKNKNDKKPNYSDYRGYPLKNVNLLGSDLPLDFWLTRFMCVILALAWIALLISVAAFDADPWFLLLVGGIGMAQNGYAAAKQRNPEARGLDMELVVKISGVKVMDVLMDVEAEYKGVGKVLRAEFFPGDLRPEEKIWWEDDKARAQSIYNAKRKKDTTRNSRKKYDVDKPCKWWPRKAKAKHDTPDMG